MRYRTTVEVATETGSWALIDVTRDDIRDTYAVEFTGGLLDQSPEALTASVQFALLEIRNWRVPGHCTRLRLPARMATGSWAPVP